jgi:DNA helicase HerA-like ATPase
MTKLWLGNSLAVGARDVAATDAARFELPSHHLVTHGVVVGMTGSGKTGLVTVLVEEASQAGVPVLVIDVKGDLPNLLLALSS